MVQKNPKIMKFLRPASIYLTACTFIFLVIPLEFYSLNSYELKFTLTDFISFLVIFWSLAILGGFVFLHLNRNLRPKIYILLTCLTWILWIQATLFQWNYGILNEGGLLGNNHRGFVEVFAYLTVVWLIFKLNKKNLEIANSFLSYLIVASFFWFLYQASIVSNTKQFDYVLDKQTLFSFSTGKNILVILIDETQANIFEELLVQNQGIVDGYQDFSVFRNTISNTNFTGHSIPMILTGKFYDNSESYSEVLERYSTDSLPKDLISQNFQTDLYFYSPDTEWFDPSFATNSRSKDAFTFEYALRLFDASIFKCSNHWIKPIIYNNGRWFLSSRTSWISLADKFLLGNDGTNNGQRSIPSPPHKVGDQDTDFVIELEHSGRVDSSGDRFKFFHLRGNHLPFNMDENGVNVAHDVENYRGIAIYKAKLLLRLFQKLKNLGVYEEATIIITSDHGSGRSQSTRQFMNPLDNKSIELSTDLARANTLLMVKQGQEVGPKYVNKPFQLVQLREMINELTRGKTLNDYVRKLPDHSIRRYFTYHHNDKYPFVRDYNEYLVVGPVWSQNSFIKYHRHVPNHESPNCFFDNQNRGSHYSYWVDVVPYKNAPLKITARIPDRLTKSTVDITSSLLLFAEVGDTNKFDVNLQIEILDHEEPISREVTISPDNPFLEVEFSSATNLFGKQLVITSNSPVSLERLHVFLD